MIKDILEKNFPEYATLSQATVTLQDMGEKAISSQVKIDGDITPDFSFDWEVWFKGERYIMPLRKPQGTKDNSSTKATYDLTFEHWAIHQLKRYYFPTMQSIDSGTAVPDKYNASVSLNLKDFCDLFGQVLSYYYGSEIKIDLNPAWEYKQEPTTININNSYIWDVLQQMYELFGARWSIERAEYGRNLLVGSGNPIEKAPEDNDPFCPHYYVIKVGYSTTEVSQIFEYGFSGGLMKTERQVQDDTIKNLILGRGGDKNLPFRYFKKQDANNPTFAEDPDWIPELENIYFSEMRGATFRSYIQGWKYKHLDEYQSKYPQITEWTITAANADEAYAPWAWIRGFNDEKFSPVEFVADAYDDEEVEGNNGYNVVADSSIAKYGELFDGLENNNEIFPTIQGVSISGIGRIDECIAVEKILSDDIEQEVENDAKLRDAVNCIGTIPNVAKSSYKTATIKSKGAFTIPQGKTANLSVSCKILSVTDSKSHPLPISNNAEITNQVIRVFNSTTGVQRPASGIPAGTWEYEVDVTVHNMNTTTMFNITVGDNDAKITDATLGEQNHNTWDIWVKNIWQSKKAADETAIQYAERVWGKILGDREKTEAKIVFSDGDLSVSEDYEFTIIGIPKYEEKLCTWDEALPNGTTKTNSYTSHWRITLAKSDADIKSLGVYIPSTTRQAVAGNHFFFIGIDMPYMYVNEAERRLDDYKKDELNKVKEIKPTFVVGVDKIRIHDFGSGKANALVNQLNIGNTLRLADKRFITNEIGADAAYETLYLQSITYNYQEPTEKDANIMPDVEIVLSEKYETVANPVARLSGEVTALQKQIGAISSIEQIIRAVGDKLYLRKDGLPDRSLSPTEFASLLSSTQFRAGMIGGAGWGLYKDDNDNWVLEADRINVRQEMQVNNLVINQISVQGGMIIECAAQIEITKVEESSTGYKCFFDLKQGSVANLFKLGDIGYCNRFTAANAALKFYKRRIIGIGDDYIILTKDNGIIATPGGIADNGVNGSGIPEQGDVVAHFGSYIDTTRQYVKVRDVIGGGYERYLDTLNSVNAAGREYYFVGKQDGQNPRWFVGNKSKDYAEFKNNELTLRCKLTVDSTIGGKTVDDLTNKEPASVNLLRNSAFRQGLSHWSASFGNNIISTDESIRFDNDPTVKMVIKREIEDRYWGIKVANSDVVAVKSGDWITASVYSRTDNLSMIDSSAVMEIEFYDANKNKIGGQSQLIKPTVANSWERYSKTVQCPLNVAFIGVFFYLQKNGTLWLAHPMLAKGEQLYEWSRCPNDFDYITDALKESTSINGGLVQTSRLEVGYTQSDGTRVTTAGTNGVYSGDERGGGLAFFAGGNGLTEENTTFGIRQDGTGYAASRTLQFLKEALHVGENEEIRLNKDGLFMYDGNDIKLRISNSPVEFDTEEIGMPTQNINEYQARSGTAYVNYPFFNQFGFNEVYISDVQENEFLSINVIVTVNTLWSADVVYQRYPSLRVRLYCPGYMISEHTASFVVEKGRSVAKVPITFRSDCLDDYWLEIDIINHNIELSTEPTKQCNASLVVEGTRNVSVYNQTQIGNNGICSIWENHALAINDQAFIARVGQYAIRITEANGLEKNQGGGWEPFY